MTDTIEVARAGFSDQGKLGPLLLTVYGPTLTPENGAAREAGLPASSLEDELMAADDFYFSTIELMDCCWLAHSGDEIVGAACVNPYVFELQYVAVLPEWRRKGIARKLVGLCLAELSKRGADHVRVETSLPLADDGGAEFIRALGFGEIRQTATFGRRIVPAFQPASPTDDEDDG